VPEGDTIHRTAATLRTLLEGRAVRRVELPRRARQGPPTGTPVERVEARGKHLLIHFAGGLALHTHLGMHGSWHVYRAGERWRRSPGQASVIIETDDGMVAVCFSAAVVELLAGREKGRGLEALGPDLCEPEPDLDTALARLDLIADPHSTIAEALLDQRVAAGIGNVYKSEVLFVCGVDPFTPVGAVDGRTRRSLLVTAARLLRANLDGGPRRTVPGGLAVYGRSGRPCRRCGTPVRSRRHGVQARTTYWCPTCQRSPETDR
jgi:endonuclease VIII